LVRRDPETQFLLHRDRLADMTRQNLPDGADIFASRFESMPFQTMIAVAPKRSKDFRRILGILEKLREAGIAE
jgi:hypothetical protein